MRVRIVETQNFLGERNKQTSGPGGLREGVTRRQCSWNSSVIWNNPGLCESQEVNGHHLCTGSDEVSFLDSGQAVP